jgi:hypothetical protein
MAEPFTPISSSRDPKQPPAGSKPVWRTIAPVPANAPKTPDHYQHGKPSRTEIYRDTRGRLLGHVCRSDLPGGETEGKTPRPRHKDALLAILEGIELWHSPDKIPYATIPVDSHFENYEIRARGFRLWLGHQFFKATGAAASKQATEEASHAEALALFEGQEHVPYIRHGHLDDRLYLDMADESWRAVEIITGDRQIIKGRRCATLLSKSSSEIRLSSVMRGIVICIHRAVKSARSASLGMPVVICGRLRKYTNSSAFV